MVEKLVVYLAEQLEQQKVDHLEPPLADWKVGERVAELADSRVEYLVEMLVSKMVGLKVVL